MAEAGLRRRHADKLMARGGGLNPPPKVVASWPKPNYIDPITHNWAGSIVVLVALAISIVIFIARIWARLVVSKNAGLDDLIMSFAMIALIGTTIAVVLGCQIYGYQLHVWDLDKRSYITIRQMAWTIELTYLGSSSLIKISILCFYRRLSNRAIGRGFMYWVWGTMASVVAYFVSFTFAVVFTCNPVQGYWRMFDLMWRLQNEMKCHDEGPVIVAVVVVSTIQDFVIYGLPISLLWNLQIPRRQKAALIAIFAMGLLTCICGIIRTYYGIYLYFFSYDISWYGYYAWIWTAVELHLAVICASAPALKVFFHRYFNFTGTRSKTSGKKASPGNSSGNSHGRPRGNQEMGGEWTGGPVPLEHIRPSTGMDGVEDVDDARSHMSSSSTRQLTALPEQHPSPDESRSKWGSRTLITAFQPGSSHNINHDIERDAART